MIIRTFFGFDIDQAREANPHLAFRSLRGDKFLVTEKRKKGKKGGRK